MDKTFWMRRWENREIGFHEKNGNPLFFKHFNNNVLKEGSRVFLPLCGKTVDIVWLLSKGYRVVGVEFSEIAIAELFVMLGITPAISEIGALKCYSHNKIDVFVGDFFDLKKEQLGEVDFIYDRAALMALPPETRCRYSAHLMTLTNNARQLIICYEYDQSLMDGPPFSVEPDEIIHHYKREYNIKLLDRKAISGGVRGKIPANEAVWLLNQI